MLKVISKQNVITSISIHVNKIRVTKFEMDLKVKKGDNKIWETRQCAIKGCSTVFGTGISVHRFPKEENMLLKWIEATQINCVSLSTIICGLHFKLSDYIDLSKW